MQVNFEELKTLYRSLYVNVDDLVMEKEGVSDDDMARSELAYDRLMLISKLAAEICKYRPMPINKN